MKNLPKIELHLHLEGAIPLPALWEIIEKYGGDPSVPDVPALEKKCQYRDFPHFIDAWQWKNGCLREYEDCTHIAAAVADDLARQNIRYAEAFYSPGDFSQHGLQAQRITEAVRVRADILGPFPGRLACVVTLPNILEKLLGSSPGAVDPSVFRVERLCRGHLETDR